MSVDLLAASRRPWKRLLHDCPFPEWENIALFVDGGSAEALRWAGGLGFVLEELGISQVLDLQVGAHRDKPHLFLHRCVDIQCTMRQICRLFRAYTERLLYTLSMQQVPTAVVSVSMFWNFRSWLCHGFVVNDLHTTRLAYDRRCRINLL